MVARRGLIIAFMAVVLSTLSLVASACGERTAVAQPSFSYAEQPRLLDIGDFALVASRPTRVMLHVDSAERLRVLVYATTPLDSVSLRRVAAADGSLVTVQAVTLDGSPHGGRTHVSYALLTHTSVEAGYYRLDLTGSGRIISLSVERHR